MATSATIPVTVSPEAQARIAELGLQREFEQMMEHTLQTVPGLFSLRVELVEKDEDDEPAIVLWCHKTLPPVRGPDPVEHDWVKWQIASFPPEKLMHFVMICIYGADRAR
jgi:hypothetical protein